MKQPKPIQNTMPHSWLLVVKDMLDRNEEGARKYKTYLQPFNGRNQLWDAYQEALDLCVYLRTKIEEEKQHEVS